MAGICTWRSLRFPVLIAAEAAPRRMTTENKAILPNVNSKLREQDQKVDNQKKAFRWYVGADWKV